MLRSILIGLDGSDDGRAAVDLGLRWAKDFDAKAIGLAVADEPGVLSLTATAGESAFADVVIGPSIEDVRRDAAEALRSFAERCEAEGVRHEAREETGTPFEQFLIEAQRSDIVVLGTRAHYEYRWRESADETLEKVLRGCPRPVVTVPARPSDGEIVVVAYDGSAQAARALYALEASGLARSRPIHVVSVFPDRSQAEAVSSRAIDFLLAHDLDPRAIPISSAAAPAGALLEQVRRLGAGLLVMGAYGRSVFHEFFLGSVTRSALVCGTVPVFCDR
jgi:nucleotide-binding universal stress UspA family protein